MSSPGFVASAVVTTDALGVATLNYTDPGFIPKVIFDPFFTDNGTNYMAALVSVTNTQAKVKVTTMAIVSVLGIDVLGAVPAVGKNIYVLASQY